MSEGSQSSRSKSPSPQRGNREDDDIKLTKDIVVVMVKKDNKEVREIIPNVDIRPYLNQDQELILARLVDKLKGKYAFSLQYCEIAFFLHLGEIYMGCGSDPISQDIVFTESEYLDHPQIVIRARDFPVSLIHKLMSQQVNEKAVNERDQQQGNDVNKCRRTKQRRIGYIIDKVVKWRQYYTGIKQDGVLKRYSLEEAANKVGISKKSLDDYLLQVRFGRKYGFNFNEHKNDKVGVLRDYVRKNKKNGKVDQKKKKRNKGNNQEQSV